MCRKRPEESADYRNYHIIFCTIGLLLVHLPGDVSGSQGIVGKRLTIGSVTKYPIVKLVIIHEEFCRLSNRDAIVS